MIEHLELSIDELFLDEDSPRLGKLALADAFRYTIKRREALTRFVTDGRLEPDNKIAEGHPINRIEELMPWHSVESTLA